jgi:LSD1 subclass zinc finger protein
MRDDLPAELWPVAPFLGASAAKPTLDLTSQGSLLGLPCVNERFRLRISDGLDVYNRSEDQATMPDPVSCDRRMTMAETLEIKAPTDPVVGVVWLRVTVDCPNCGQRMALTEKDGAAHVRCAACGHEQTFAGESANGVALRVIRSIGWGE